MFKTITRLTVTAAAASMAFAPIAAQANTRAGDSAAIYTNSAAQPGLARSAEGEDFVGRPGVLIALFAAAAVIGAIVIIADDDGDDDNASPGA